MSHTPHQQRVVAEKVELDAKIKALETFIDTNAVFLTLNREDKMDMIEQRRHMRDYSNVLNRRINRF
jgi:hypothetical protein